MSSRVRFCPLPLSKILHRSIKHKARSDPRHFRDVLLLPPALEALQQQKKYTFGEKGRVFHNPQTKKPWETSQQIRRTQWMHILKKAGIRYRNTYQTRHTYASMMLSQGENIMWVSKQLGHVDVEMVIKTYGRWIPDNSSQSGYRPIHDWSHHLG